MRASVACALLVGGAALLASRAHEEGAGPDDLVVVADVEPTGERRQLDDVIRVVFDGPVDALSVEASFVIDPPTGLLDLDQL